MPNEVIWRQQKGEQRANSRGTGTSQEPVACAAEIDFALIDSPSILPSPPRFMQISLDEEKLLSREKSRPQVNADYLGSRKTSIKCEAGEGEREKFP